MASDRESQVFRERMSPFSSIVIKNLELRALQRTVGCKIGFWFWCTTQLCSRDTPYSAWPRLCLIHLSPDQGSLCTASMTETL